MRGDLHGGGGYKGQNREEEDAIRGISSPHSQVTKRNICVSTSPLSALPLSCIIVHLFPSHGNIVLGVER